MLFPGWIYIAWGFWHFENFCNMFLPNTNKDQKKVLSSERRAPGTVSYCGKYGPGYLHYVHK